MHRQDSTGRPTTKLSDNTGSGRATIPERVKAAQSNPHKVWEQMWFQFVAKVILSFENKVINDLNGSGGGKPTGLFL
jgi:hypothetical protein